MDQEYPFRARGRHGFDRDDVINYIAQAQASCNEHLARLAELETAKQAWQAQAKTLERELGVLKSRNQELEQQLNQERMTGAAQRQELEWALADKDGGAPGGSAGPAEADELRAKVAALEEQLSSLKEAKLTEPARPALSLVPENGDSARTQELHAQILQLTDRVNQTAAELEAQVQSAREWKARAESFAEEKAAAEEHARHLDDELLEQTGAAYSAKDKITALELAAQKEKDVLTERITALEAEASRQADSFSRQAAHAEALELEKIALTEHIASLQETIAGLEGITAGLEETIAALKAKRAEDETEQDAKTSRLEFALEDAHQAKEALDAEIVLLRSRIEDLEAQLASEKGNDTLRSMMLASFNYSNLYVENNLKTAQVISDATTKNIGRASESAAVLLEQVETIVRAFNDNVNQIRSGLSSFQRELMSMQSGMSQRLSKDKFSALLEENERLREELEHELLAELNEDSAADPILPSPDAPLPFAEPQRDYRDYLN
ncbi:MAG: hypothetical protein LBJ11_01830 [Oscillospiraceae bacterium]|jgi:chromosome segregation ATPase|nr:hypothetical protein [Oscillospiraceae bacterium]